MEIRSVQAVLGVKVCEMTQSQRDLQPVTAGRQVASPSEAASLPTAWKPTRTQGSIPEDRSERLKRQELWRFPHLPSASRTHPYKAARWGSSRPPRAEARMPSVSSWSYIAAIMRPPVAHSQWIREDPRIAFDQRGGVCDGAEGDGGVVRRRTQSRPAAVLLRERSLRVSKPLRSLPAQTPPLGFGRRLGFRSSSSSRQLWSAAPRRRAVWISSHFSVSALICRVHCRAWRTSLPASR